MAHFKKTILLLFISGVIALLLLIAGSVLAQSGGNYTIGSWSVDHGGNTSSGGFYELHGVAGQYDATANNALTGGSYQLTGGFFHMGTTPVEQFSISLSDSWSMISSYLDPVQCSVGNLLGDILGNMVLFKNGAGEVYWPDQTIDDIGCWNWEEGYQIYMQSPDILTITGTMIDPEAEPIELPAGWSLIPYLDDEPQPVKEALTSIEEQLYLLKDGGGQVYWPEYDVDLIGDMQPGEGYQVNLTEPGTLIYPMD